MSYRAFKRLLGETSLERKCRFLFGAFILLLLAASFSLYAHQTESLAYEQITKTCRLLVPPALARQHVQASREALQQFKGNWDEHWPGELPQTRYRILKPTEQADNEMVKKFLADP